MRGTIMVVDDEKDIRRVVKDVLEDADFKVIEAVNGDDCLAKLEFNKPDLILLDIMMPGIPVKELVEKINNIKIAFLSVVKMTESDIKAFGRNKIVDFIQKPFEIEDLANRVRKIVE